MRKLLEKTALGARIRIARGRKTQAELGLEIHQPKSVISLWETGKRALSAEHLAQIAQATGYDLGWFLRADEDRPPLKVQAPAPAYTSPETAEMVEALNEIMASGQETIISALRQNIRAFLVAARALGGGKKGARRERRQGPHGDPERRDGGV